MSSSSPSPLASLDDSLTLPRKSLGKLRAAKPVEMAEVIAQLNRAAESAGIVRARVSSELPEASWQNRQELDALLAEIQKILEARALQQLRSRVLALATELERGSIVHRRALRINELNQLREQAINELRSQASLEGAPPTLPGPEAAQWVEWACGLKEPEDAESLQTLRNGFAHLDDFVANLELNMWVAGRSPALETLPQPERAAAGAQPKPSRRETSGFEKPVMSSGPDLAMKVGFDRKDEEVANPMLAENPTVSQMHEVAASSDVPASPSTVPVLADAVRIPLASLDHSLILLSESLERLKAAKPVEMAEVIAQLNLAAESAGIVRAWVSSELPEASWQNRAELDALLAEIQKILEARALQQLRSRVLALATELERGSIVHRRTLRINELNQLRDQAINELRSQASLEGAPPTLPGPEAEQWVEWACGLKEPEDAESLQTLRNGFAHLDDFVANLELNMWVAGRSPALETLPQPERAAARAQPKPSRRETSGFEPLVSGPVQIGSRPAESSEGRHEPQFPRPVDGLSLMELESNTLTPFDVTPPRTEGELQGIHDQERALLGNMIGLVTDPARHFNSPVEPPSAAEAFRETSGALAIASHSVESPLTPDAFRETGAAPAIASHTFESPFTDEAFRQARAARASTRQPIEMPSRAEVSRHVTAAPPIASDLRTRVAKLWGQHWILLVAIAVLVFASLAAIWRSNRNRAGSASLNAIETTTPGLTRNNPEDKLKGNDQSGMPTDTESHTSSPNSPAKEASKPKDQSVAPKPLAKASSAKPAGNRDDAVLLPPAAIAGNIAQPEAPPSAIPGLVPGGLANGAPASVINIVKNVPVAEPKIPVTEPKIAPQKVRVSSGVAEGLLVHQVLPRYPQPARQARVEGTVVLQVIIGKDGTVQSLHVVSGHPMLTQAATDAVKQWRYKPYSLDGEPVEADTQINVKFTLPPGG